MIIDFYYLTLTKLTSISDIKVDLSDFFRRKSAHSLSVKSTSSKQKFPVFLYPHHLRPLRRF